MPTAVTPSTEGAPEDPCSEPVGLAGGYQLVATFRRQLPTLLAGLAILAATAGVAVGGGMLLGLSAPMTAGTFSGSLTATPALAAATDASGGSGEPAVGYSLGYPVGVTLSIVIISASGGFMPCRLSINTSVRFSTGRPRR